MPEERANRINQSPILRNMPRKIEVWDKFENCYIIRYETPNLSSHGSFICGEDESISEEYN